MTLHGRKWSLLSLVWALAACSASNPVKLDTAQHIKAPTAPAPLPNEIPQPVQRSFVLPPPKPQAKTETYSVVVNKVPVHELLFALARDAKVNVDIHPGITGTVTLNALEQTLPQLLNRIARQVDMRFEIDGPNLVVMPDSPMLRTYRVDYVNMSRDSTNAMAISSAVGSWVSGSNKSAVNPNGSSNSLNSASKNHFYETLIQNLKDLLRETDRQLPATFCTDLVLTKAGENLDVTTVAASQGSSNNPDNTSGRSASATDFRQLKCSEIKETATVISNQETGVITVRATSRQHEKVQAFLDTVLSRVKRQVLIDVTVAEVQLSQNYQQGIDWSALNLFDTGLKIVQKAAGSISGPSANLVELDYASRGGNFSSTVKLLDSFGTVKVLSSPKLSVLNNQTAVMKVVDDSVYFTYEIKETEATATTAAKTTVTSTLHTVPVGLVLSLTPQVGDDDTVTLSIRPSISRVIGQKDDPSLDLFKTGTSIRNTIPLIRSREFDSVMRVANGNIAVMGGLMEDLLQNNDNAVPGISATPWLGGLFQNRDDTKRKTELVIFVRPTIIRDASLEGDFSAFKALVPNERFFESAAGPATIPGSRP
ncbi:MAG: pilus (MSHA type) biogenesis protein MshL [Uliginosibacterium sp.]|nr:pilus (MSHA type) biogenesis protein MshL [Uliginosibacterium sp.]MBK9615686.1 pilus (MSHA type) biogenesis protein MshL [Uliginosibacterium sp.]